MCTSWNHKARCYAGLNIITYWEMCTSWNHQGRFIGNGGHYNLLGNVH